MKRRAFPIALLLLGLTSALLVARLPSDLEGRLVTRRHHNSDPLLNCALLQFNVTSLLHHPTRYFEPPILFPDRNPYRSTEPLVAQALLAVPFRLALGARPALVYTSVLITSLALVAIFTGLLLRELGVRPSVALAAGCLSVLVSTTTIFVDRLQAVSIQWLPLGLFFATRYLRHGGRLPLTAFVGCTFLTVQASLYTSVMIGAAALFLVPLLIAWRGEPEARARGPALAGALVAAAALCLLVLWPYLRDREDVAAYASAAYAAHKPWGHAYLADVAISPPEYGRLGWPLEPWASWDGAYPGAAFVLLLASVASLSLAARAGRGTAPALAHDGDGGAAFRASKPVLAALLLALALSLLVSARGGPALARASGDGFLWAALAAWCLRLGLWPRGAGEARLHAFGSAAWLAALVLFLLSLGSPIALSVDHPPLLHGLFGPLSSLFPALRELRELKRFLLPAGWAAVVAAALSLEPRLRHRPSALAPALAALVLAIGLLERARADTRSVSVPRPPGFYALLESSQTRGGLLELPFDSWGRINSVKRMLWQPEHGRPIVAGKGGLDPAWYTPAGKVFDEFPSEESVLLLRAWGITSVLDARPDASREPLTPLLPEGLTLRAELERPGGAARLFDVAHEIAPSGLEEPATGVGVWQTPEAATSAARLVADGSFDSAATVEGPDGLLLVPAGGAPVSAVELDYGRGRFSRVPARLRVLGFVDGAWSDVTKDSSGQRLRARAAVQFMRDRRARIVIALRPGSGAPLRLVADPLPWDLPEARLLLASAEQR